jgi:hypothetical protein
MQNDYYTPNKGLVDKRDKEKYFEGTGAANTSCL